MQPAGICPTCHHCLPGWWIIAEPNKPSRKEYNHCKNPAGDRESCLCWKPDKKGYGAV